MAITNRGERSWLVRVYLGRDPQGKRKWYSETVRGSKRDAQRVERSKQAKKDRGRLTENARMSVATYLDRWLNTAAKQKVRARTYASYRQVLTAYVIPELGMRQLSRLFPMDVQEMVNSLNARDLSPRTVRYAVTVLRQALRQAVRWRLLANNPVEAGDVTLPKQVRKERRVLTRAEVERLLKTADGSRLEALWRVAIATAMRPGEYLGLKWEDVDFEVGRVRVQRTLQPGGRFAECKTARSRRSIALPPSILRALREHKARQNEERLALGAEYRDTGLIFCTPFGAPLDHNNLVHYHFAPLLHRAELPHIRLYDLRHTGATLLLEAGENLKSVSNLLGHASITLTADVYAHVTPEMQEQTAERMEAILAGQGGY